MIDLEALEEGAVRGTSGPSSEIKAAYNPIITARVVAVLGEVVGERGEEIPFDETRISLHRALLLTRSGMVRPL